MQKTVKPRLTLFKNKYAECKKCGKIKKNK